MSYHEREEHEAKFTVQQNVYLRSLFILVSFAYLTTVLLLYCCKLRTQMSRADEPTKIVYPHTLHAKPPIRTAGRSFAFQGTNAHATLRAG